MSYTMSIEVDRGYDEVVASVRDALAAEGFGVLTEIDVRETLRSKLGVDGPDHVILGACRPELAHRALTAAPTIAALLPCNVSVRRAGDRTVVDVVDPAMMAELEGRPEVVEVAAEARDRLSSALRTVARTAGG